MDAVPGRLNLTSAIVTKPGMYYGSCYELCGVYHGFMPINIIAVPVDIWYGHLLGARANFYKIIWDEDVLVKERWFRKIILFK